MTSPGERIDDLIASTTDWRGPMFATLRALIHQADPDITEEWKWVTPRRPGTPVFEHDGMICHVNLLNGRVRLTMHEGAHLPDPHGLFNASLEGNERRAIDLYEGALIDADGIRDLVRAGVARRALRARTSR